MRGPSGLGGARALCVCWRSHARPLPLARGDSFIYPILWGSDHAFATSRDGDRHRQPELTVTVLFLSAHGMFMPYNEGLLRGITPRPVWRAGCVQSVPGAPPAWRVRPHMGHGWALGAPYRQS
jgi:hypothetical protein